MKEEGTKTINDKRMAEVNEKLLSNQRYSLHFFLLRPRKIRDLESTIEAATRFMSEKDEEIRKLEEQISSMKMQHMRMSRPAPSGDIRIEGQETFPGCSNNSGCYIF